MKVSKSEKRARKLLATKPKRMTFLERKGLVLGGLLMLGGFIIVLNAGEIILSSSSNDRLGKPIEDSVIRPRANEARFLGVSVILVGGLIGCLAVYKGH